MDTTASTYTPPPGWVTNRQAAEMLTISLSCVNSLRWRYRPLLHGTGKPVRLYPRGITYIYPLEVIERIKAAQATDAVKPPPPEGFVDKDGACAFVGVHRRVWQNWIGQGKVRCGKTVPSRFGGKRALYALEDLHRLKANLADDSQPHIQTDPIAPIPAGYLTKLQACTSFGVTFIVWERWEREGVITCGTYIPGSHKLYKVEDIHRLLDEYGKYCPPYPDPNLPNAYRVPLNGQDIKTREAIIDAETLPLIEGASLSLGRGDERYRNVALCRPGKGNAVLARVILNVEDPALQVRHVNKNPLDCRRSNLVVRTIQQRCRNAGKMKHIEGVPTSSRFKGVTWDKQTKKWRAMIQPNRKTRSLGRFTDEIAAAQAYDEAARQWFGQDAHLNFPNGLDAWLDAEGFTSSAQPIPRAA